MTMHNMESPHRIFMFKVVLLEYSAYMFLFHAFACALAISYLYKSYGHFKINTKE